MAFVLITEEGLPAFAAAFWPWKVMSVRRGRDLSGHRCEVDMARERSDESDRN